MDIPTEQCFKIENGPAATPSEAPPVVDAIIHVSIDDGGLRAYINIEPPINGGATPTFEGMKAALANAGISYNIDFEKLYKNWA